ncbi:MAG: hypothetical protein A3B04_01515 [Candidatus Portnoybacteria bacterium RIFCSPLOWO2_02_FULL_39_11]|uniref:Uncharacterized protein n=1 Tax=Candidatus Portnoybacteria bacterium RIFCSPLOWO2_02_FULL_39_11 TaxID=1802001 RepID=A0A1G2FRN4_9BACT|nr:MAG: hypothetical protein A3B04_01515 [Candidatus Portnoybacteria bacterium RIFCSPLOWO2_02_FULL_39_11]
MNYIHKELAQGRWFKLSFFEQMANVGSEVGRAINWRGKNAQYFQAAFERALELLDLTIDDAKNKKRLRELWRVREVMADYFQFDNIYGSTDKSWQNYFYAFNYAARLAAGV